MGVEIGVVERQGRGRGRGVVLVRWACLSWRSVVSWRRFPLVPWRHSFSSRMLLRVVDRARQDGVAEHQDCACEEGDAQGRLLHGRAAAEAGRMRAADGEAATSWMRRRQRRAAPESDGRRRHDDAGERG